MSTSLVFDLIAHDRASDKFDKLGNSADKSTGKLKKLAKAGALAVGAAAVIAGKALFDMGKMAAEDQRSQAMLEKALKNGAKATDGQVASVEKWITAQGKALGIADDQLRPALSKLVTATGDVSEAQKLSSLALDVSTGTGKSYTSIVDALVRAQNGQISGLSRLGIETKKADGSTKSLKEVTGDMAKLYGGQAAAAAETTAGKWQRLKLRFDEARESIGAKLLPVGEKLADFALNKLGPAVAKVGDWVREKLLPPLKDFAGDMAPKARQIMDALKGAFDDARPAFELLGRVVTKVVLPALGFLLKAAGPVLAGAFKALGKVIGAVGEVGIWLWNKALQPAFKLIVKGVAWVMDGWAKMLGALGKVPGFGWAKTASEAMGAAADKARDMADGIKKIPTKKRVDVTVAYRYTGLRNGSGPTRGRDDELMPRMSRPGGFGAYEQQATADNFTLFERATAKGTGKAAKAGLEKWKTFVDGVKSKFEQLKSDMSTLSSAVASAWNPDVFGGTIDEFWSGLTGNNSGLQGALALFDKLKGMGASTSFLTSLFQSGNKDVATALAAGPASAVQQASSLFGQNAALADKLGDKVAVNEYGPKAAAQMTRIEKALTDELPKKLAKELRAVLRDLRIEVGDAGGVARGRGARFA